MSESNESVSQAQVAPEPAPPPVVDTPAPAPVEVDTPAPNDIDSMSDEQFDTLFEQQANAPEPDDEEKPQAPNEASNEVKTEPSDDGQTAPKAESGQEGETQNSKTVPLAALHEERAKRKEIAAEKARMEQRFDQLMERLGPSADNSNAPPEEPPVTSLEENPIAHFQEKIARAEAELAELKARDQDQAQRAEQSLRMNQVYTTYRQDFGRLVQERPELESGYNQWTESRIRELQAGGATPEQATKLLQQEETAAVVHALRQGESPAERVYAIVKARGHLAKPAAPAAPAAPASGPDPDVIERGQRRATGTPGGGTAPVADSLEALANMDDEEFEKNWDRIMGRD